MKSSPHLVVDVSSHGFGHASMVTAVLQALRAISPGLLITIRSALPRNWFAARLIGDFAYVQQIGGDVGLVMHDAFSVNRDASYAAYSRLHADWPHQIDRGADALVSLSPTALLSNVTYLSLEAAKLAGIPSIAFGPLNWADLFQFYCGQFPGAAQIHRQIIEAYRTADSFLRTIPAMPMANLGNRQCVGPISRIGQNRKPAIFRKFGLPKSTALVLVTLGGIQTKLDFSHWPRLGNICVIASREQHSSHPDVIALEDLALPFIDILASSDAAITKPGYGMVTESICNGVPILLLPRGDWPEAEFLGEWANRAGRTGTLPLKKLTDGRFVDEVAELIKLPGKPIPKPTGVSEICHLLASAFKDGASAM